MVTSEAFQNATTTAANTNDRPLPPPSIEPNQSAVNSAAVGTGNAQKDAETDVSDNADFLNAETQKALFLLEKQGFLLVAGGGLEPPTHGFSVRCSTN